LTDIPSPSRLVGFDPAIVERAVTDPAQLGQIGNRLSRAHTTVVIVGSSVSGLVLAARMGAESRRDSGMAVVLVAGGPPVPRRLIAGCTMRWSTVYRMAAAMSVDMRTMVDRLGGERACFRRLALEYLDLEAGAAFGTNAVPVIPRTPFAAMSTRHGAILTALRASLDPTLPITVIDGDVRSGSGLRESLLLDLAQGPGDLTLPHGRHVVLNATSRADLLRAPDRLAAPARWTVVAQAPLAPITDAPRSGLADTGWIPATAGRTAPHLSFVTPFRDADSPDASWYGINAITVSDRQLRRIGRDALVSEVSDRLLELESAYGLREVDPEHTRATAVVPIIRQSGQHGELAMNDGSPVVDVHRSFTSGASAIAADGMLAATVGADTFADAFLEAGGSCPATAARAALGAADRALRGIRARNVALEMLYFRQPLPPRRALAAVPTRLLRTFLEDIPRAGSAQRTQSTVNYDPRRSATWQTRVTPRT
jgi:hypothetical protein